MRLLILIEKGEPVKMEKIYLGLTTSQHVVQTVLVLAALVFLGWSIKLALEKA